MAWSTSRRCATVVALAAPALLVGSPALAAAGQIHTRSNLVQATLCPTTYGIPSTHPVSRWVHPEVSIPHGFTFYVNQALIVLAPAGWKCSGEIGADGSGGLAITASGGRAIDAEEGSICSGCNFAIACPLFPAAKQLQPELACPSTPPAEERLYKLSKLAVAFEDPPYVHGTGQPSGGRDPANGVVLYSAGPPDQALEETCTLPDSDHAECAAVLNEFTARYTAMLSERAAKSTR